MMLGGVTDRLPPSLDWEGGVDRGTSRPAGRLFCEGIDRLVVHAAIASVEAGRRAFP